LKRKDGCGEMLRPLRLYGLIAVAAVLVWVNLRPPATIEVVKSVERAVQAPTSTSQAGLRPQPSGSNQWLAVLPLPVTLTRPKLEVAVRDPFVLKPRPLAAQVPTQPAPPPIAVQAVLPQPPVAPPLNLTFAGRMTAPDGSQILYVANGASTQSIAVGQDLPNGYRVDAITAQAVEFSYPLQTNARLDLPAPPKFEIR
jgi:hypothetical protein